jgi:predicted ATPase
MTKHPQLDSITIQGYRPFKDFQAKLGSLEVIVGTNGSGKSSLFEFLGALRDGLDSEIPPGLARGGAGRMIYHAGAMESIRWNLVVTGLADTGSFVYEGALSGPFGRDVESERVMYDDGGAAGPNEVMAPQHGRADHAAGLRRHGRRATGIRLPRGCSKRRASVPRFSSRRTARIFCRSSASSAWP